ncbi:MAG: hypothetical protein H0X62_11755 [Bacteroidetes bacterium]|nr:hypothetical protein [Bacteroidota bacterium]
MRTLISFTILVIAIFAVSCKQEHTPIKNIYEVEQHYSKQEKDSLLTDLITYIYKKPKGADYETRFEPKYRNWFVQALPLFEFSYYHISEDSTHYYYVIRPARSPKGNTRGVGGKYNLDKNGQITDFEEIFNTPILPVEQLKGRGKHLFEEMIRNNNVEIYAGNPDYIEWPDDRLKYDKEKNEWRYDVVGQTEVDL